jgi:hypothetical protein
MERMELLERRLRGAAGVVDVLAVGREIFQFIGTLCAASADQAADLYPAFTFARGAAVGGRNAIAFAPSLPAGRPALLENPALPTGDADEIADAIAGLTPALSARLREAAALALDADDRTACENAAREADRISELLTGGT